MTDNNLALTALGTAGPGKVVWCSKARARNLRIQVCAPPARARNLRIQVCAPPDYGCVCWLFIFKVTEPSSIPYRTHSACAKRGRTRTPHP